jgi:thiol-disulfide isomerase/thioredoxin
MSRGDTKSKSLPAYAGALAAGLAAVAGFAMVYALFGQGQAPSGGRVVATSPAPVAGDASAGQSAASHKLNSGQMAAFVYKKMPEPLPALSFVDADGKQRTLADWHGRVVLLNLWATWCAPCRKEMPELDSLQAELGSEKFEVVALAVDRTGAEGAKRFLEQARVGSLGLYVDASARAAAELKAVGLPTTLLIDREGREIGRLTGPAEWNSAEAKRLVSAAFAP